MQSNSHLESTEPIDSDDVYESGFSTVLIVESELRHRAALNANFLRHGWEVTTATCIRETLRAIEQQMFDLVICDLQMRDGDVHEVMLAVDEGTPVIVLASNAITLDVVKAMRNGAYDFLMKDVSFDVLQLAARTAVRDSRRNSSLHSNEPANTVSSSVPESLKAVGMTLSELNRTHLENALTLAEGNRTNAAKILGISVRTVRNKVKQYGLPPRRFA